MIWWLASAGAALILFVLPLILISFLHKDPAVLIRQFGLEDKEPFFAERFANMLAAFLTGFNLALRRHRQPIGLHERLHAECTVMYRGFAYEGAGMGLALRSLLLWWKREPVEQQMAILPPGYLYTYYVGIGWALHQVFGLRPHLYHGWRERLEPRYAPILFDGVGFKVGLLHYPRRKKIFTKFDEFAWEDRQVCFQGFGRSLWFQCEFNIEAVLEKLASLPAYARPELVNGVGMAIGYSLFDNPDRMRQAYGRIPVADRTAFLQGLAFGWEARRQQNPAYYEAALSEADANTTELIRQAVAIVQDVRDSLRPQNSYTFYSKWLKKVRHRMTDLVKGDDLSWPKQT